MELHSQVPAYHILLALCAVVVIVFFVVGMWAWKKQRQYRQQRLAEETARRLYGVGRPRYVPNRTFLTNMRTVINKLKDQRGEGQYQFAVVLFIPQEMKKLEDIHVDMNYNLWNNYPLHQQALCNYDRTFWPEKEKFYNYMVSRHDRDQHAEEIILEQFPELWEKFLQLKGRRKPSFIILYSWLMLCSRCTARLIDIVQQDELKPTKFVVAYTTPSWEREEESVAEASREKLLSNRVGVYCVSYDKHLPPGGNPAAAMVEDHQTINLEDKTEFPSL